MKNDKEIRLNQIEYREEENGKLILEGYAIVWDSETFIGDSSNGFYESIDRNALKDAYVKDVPLKYNHNDNAYILARTRNESLSLKEDDKGLFIRAVLQSDVNSHRDIYNMVRSGLLDKMSFAFNVVKQDVRKDEQNNTHRKVLRIGRLFDVSVVDTPAYNQTSIYARSVNLVETELEALENVSAKALENALELEKAKNYNMTI